MHTSKKTAAHDSALASVVRKSIVISYFFGFAAASQAVSLDFEDVTIDIDTTLTYGLQWRVEERDRNISLGGTGEDTGLDTFPALIDNAFILNGNDGNNSFDKGDMTANRLSMLSELSLSAGDYGLFIRGKAYYDAVYSANSTNLTPVAYTSFNANPKFHALGNGSTAPIGQFNPQAQEYMEMDLRLLDSFIYGDFTVGETDVAFKFGRQVISWGEGLFSGGGLLTSINRIDAQIRSTPGLELKELFLPTHALNLSFDLSDTWSFEGYYQFEWGANVIDPNSTFYQEFDSIGAGGSTFIFMSGYSQPFEVGNESYTDLQLYESAYEKRLLGLDLKDPDVLRAAQKFLPRPNCDNKQCQVLAPYLVEVNSASDQGQFGLSFKHFLDNGDELGLYFINYHERTPSFVLPLDVANDYAGLIQILVSVDGIGNPNNTRKIVNGEEVDVYRSIADFTAHLDVTQYETLLNFFSSIPEKGGTVGEITTNFVGTLLGGRNLPDSAIRVIENLLSDAGSLTDAQINQISAVSDEVGELLRAMQGLDGSAYVRSLNYRLNYAENVRAWAATYSTVIGDANVAAELIYKENMPLMSGNVARTPRRGEFFQFMVNSIFVLEPTALWDFSSLTAELTTWYLPGKKAYDPTDFDNPDRVAVQNTPNGLAYSFLWTMEWRSVMEGLDLTLPIYVNHGVEGAMFTSGYRDGQFSAAIGLSAKYLETLEISASIFANFGEKDDPFQTMIHDRDNFSLAIKYAF